MVKTDPRLVLAIVGWGLIVSIWIWLAFRYSAKNDIVGSILHVIVAVVWTIFAVVSTKKYLKQK
jgi:hypothetical protein